VYIVGINDLLGMGNAVLNLNPEFVRLQMEVYFLLLLFSGFSAILCHTPACS
jgi:hypothetical protein